MTKEPQELNQELPSVCSQELHIKRTKHGLNRCILAHDETHCGECWSGRPSLCWHQLTVIVKVPEILKKRFLEKFLQSKGGWTPQGVHHKPEDHTDGFTFFTALSTLYVTHEHLSKNGLQFQFKNSADICGVVEGFSCGRQHFVLHDLISLSSQMLGWALVFWG